MFAVAAFCRGIYPVLDKTKLASRLIVNAYAMLALMYVLTEVFLRNYFWAFVGFVAHSLNVSTMHVKRGITS